MSNANASPGGSTLKNSGIVYAMLTIRVRIVKIPTDIGRAQRFPHPMRTQFAAGKRQNQDLQDFMI